MKGGAASRAWLGWSMVFFGASVLRLLADTEIFKDDFRSFNSGPLKGEGAKWAEVAAAFEGGIAATKNTRSGRGVCLEDRTTELDRGTSTLVGVFQNSADFGPRVMCRISVIPDPAENYSAFIQLRENLVPAVCVRFMGSKGQIELQEAGKGNWKPLAPFQPNEPVELKIVLNTEDGQYDIQINDEMVVIGEPVVSSVTGINRIQVATGIVAASMGSLTVENVEITAGNANAKPSKP